jgi:hypothetical protein
MAAIFRKSGFWRPSRPRYAAAVDAFGPHMPERCPKKTPAEIIQKLNTEINAPHSPIPT